MRSDGDIPMHVENTSLKFIGLFLIYKTIWKRKKTMLQGTMILVESEGKVIQTQMIDKPSIYRL